MASEIALQESLQSGLDREFLVPVESRSPDLNSALATLIEVTLVGWTHQADS